MQIRCLGMMHDNVIEGGGGADTLDGGDGSDTASYAHAGTAVTAYLDGSDAGSGDAAGDVYINIENLMGSAYADSLSGDENDNAITGGAGDDTLIGNGGADVLDGGAGTDTASYASSGAAVEAFLDGTAGTGGHAAGDTLANIENLIGSAYGDTLTGDDGDNAIAGGAGDDMLIGGGGADALDGGAGTDTASYASSDAAVNAFLLSFLTGRRGCRRRCSQEYRESHRLSL